jgi:hypothetical protein
LVKIQGWAFMLIKAPPFRHSIERIENGVRVTIPSKPGLLKFVWFAIWLIVWSYATSGLIFILGLMVKGATETSGNGVLMMTIACLIPFVVALLGMGTFAIHTVLWHVSGKEIVEATAQTLTITKQVFRWKWSKQYLSEKIHDLRVNTQQLSVFLPRKRVKRFLGVAGMIVFDYGRRTSSFGLDISDNEAEQIILILRDGLRSQGAG